ncbi:hypothetical protein [Oceanivirga salmonicida]|uniref:hypothetical protein n=1 Tax=Oceanivirga salmonicida TaxID=1769291 RepID=UPI0012E12017|nr:hypothetical protein [Oceanivirga salmonicida]
MFDDIFMKAFKFWFAVLTGVGVGVIIFAKVNNLKLYTGLVLIFFFCIIVFCAFSAEFNSLNLQQCNITVKNVSNKDKIVELLLRKDYESILEGDGKLVYKLKTFPQYIYGDVKVNVNIDANNNKIEISAPIYLVRQLKKLNFE